MNTKEIRDLKANLILTDRQREILVGKLLGDGHLETLNHSRTYRLKIEHSIKQKDYVEWLLKEFRNWVHGNMYTKLKYERKYVGFTTYTHGALRFYAQQFYKDGKKIVPKMIYKLLSPIGLAAWFMDDGSWKSDRHSTYIIHTLGFKKDSLILLQDVLRKKFGIETALHMQRQKYWRLYIISEYAEKFRNVIEPYVLEIPSMKYKLGNIRPKK
ncbi:hypothetical protein HYS99_01105 [Candidatus Giovannonibacteria bacterium]|nr:hypothetical protein [Candidatus Giovannonibacteria bacterium]